MEIPAFDLSEPGSVIYGGRLAALGMRLNRFAAGMKIPSNREAFTSDPDAYLAMADLTNEERGRIRARDWTWLLAHGGHLQAMARIAATDGHYLFHIAAHSCGVDVETLLAACPPAAFPAWELWMGRIVGGIGISHTPSMGMEYDKAQAGSFSPHWQPWFDGTRPVKKWLDRLAPDQIIVVYNDHLNQFGFEAYPTLAIGVADTFAQADESYGLRPLPPLDGDTDFGWHVTNALVQDEFDMTVCQQLEIDHGIYSWLPYLFDRPWPAPILPIAVNMLRMPIPTSRRLWNLGAALRAAVESRPGDERVLIVSTGGMSHQITGQRFGIANEDLDRFFLSRIGARGEELVAIPQEEFMRLGGTEAAELAIWFAMRAALSDRISEVHAFYTFPKITGCGVIAFEEPDAMIADPALGFFRQLIVT